MLKTLIVMSITTLLTFPANALASLQLLEYAAELPTSNVLLPGSSAGQLVYRDCVGCEPTIWYVSADTRYESFVPAEPGVSRIVTLAEFRRAFESEQAEGVVVFYQPGTNKVTRLSLGRK